MIIQMTISTFIILELTKMIAGEGGIFRCLILWKFFFISFEGLYSERIHLEFIPTCGTIFNVVVSCLAVKCNCPECCLDINNSFILKNINIRSSGLSTGCLKNKCDLYSRLILKFQVYQKKLSLQLKTHFLGYPVLILNYVTYI